MTGSISDFAEKDPKENNTPWDTEPKTPTPTNVTVTTVTPTPASTPSVVATAPQAPVATAPVTTATTDPNEILQRLMTKIEPIGSAANFKVLIYGDPGTTKTSFAATAPNNLIVDLEDGLIAAKNSPNGVAENVQAFPWINFDAFTSLISQFMLDPEELKPFQVLTIDSFSELHKRALAEVTEREWRKRPSANRYVPETEHHMENNERIIRIVRDLRDLNRDLIMISHAKTVEPKNKPAKTYPDFSESLANKIEAMMDVVGYMTRKTIDNQIVPVLVLQSDEGIHCKSRVKLPAEIINPTYEKIRQAWEDSRA